MRTVLFLFAMLLGTTLAMAGELRMVIKDSDGKTLYNGVLKASGTFRSSDSKEISSIRITNPNGEEVLAWSMSAAPTIGAPVIRRFTLASKQGDPIRLGDVKLGEKSASLASKQGDPVRIGDVKLGEKSTSQAPATIANPIIGVISGRTMQLTQNTASFDGASSAIRFDINGATVTWTLNSAAQATYNLKPSDK